MNWPLAIVCFVAGFVVMHLILNDVFGTKLKESQKELECQKKRLARLRIIETFKKFDIEFDHRQITTMQLMDLFAGRYNGRFK